MMNIPISPLSKSSIEKRFWSKVRKEPGAKACWEWTASKRHGYGNFGVGSRSDGTRTVMSAPRVSWIMTYGDIPDRLWVLHKCDNPACVRPNHLFLGTHGHNMKDMATKNRRKGPLGQSHPDAKLTDDQVKEIRTRYSREAANGKLLASEYGVSNVMIYRIAKRLNWRHIK